MSNQKMRKNLFGGFKKKDVVRYVESITEEKDTQIEELKLRIAELEKEIAELKEDKEIKAEGMMDALVADAVEQNKVLSATVTDLSHKLNRANDEIDALTEQNRKLESEKEFAFNTVASTQAELMHTKELIENNKAVVAMQNDGTRDIYSIDELLQEVRSYRMIASALRENSRKLTDSLSKQLDFADTCIDSLTTVKEK